MQAKHQSHLIKVIGGAFVLLAAFVALFGVGGTPIVHAQEQPTSVPEVFPTEGPMQPPLSLPESSCAGCEANPYRAYVSTFNPRNLIEFDTQSNTITRQGLAGPVDPHVSAMMPNGKQVFMAGWGNGIVYGVDTTTYQITTTILTQGMDQRGLVISKDNTRLYVSDNLRKQVIAIDLTTNTVIAKIALNAHPEQIAISPDDSRVYVAANTPGTFIVIDTVALTISQSISVGSTLTGIYASRDGKKVFASDRGVSKIFVFDTSDFHQITAINAANPFFLFANADGSKLYSLRYGDSILVFDTRTFKFLKKIDIGDRQLSAALTRDGVHMYIGLKRGNIAVLDTTTDTIVQTIHVGGTPHAVAAMLPQAVNPNLSIQNGGFNGYPTNTSMIPRYWVATGFSPTDGKFTAFKKEGSASVKIAGASGATKIIYQTFSQDGSAGDEMTFSYWARGNSIPTTGGFCRGQIFIYNAASTLVTAQTVDCSTGTYATFQKKSIVFTVPAAYSKIVVKFMYSKPTGTIMFDMASLLIK